MSRRRRGYWLRYDRAASSGALDHVFAVDGDDPSPPHYCYPTGFDARCSCCLLNIPHSEQLHRQATGAGRRSPL